MDIYQLGASFFEDVPLVEYMYLVFTRMPGERYRSRLSQVFVLCNKIKQKNRRVIRIYESAILFDLSIDLFISRRWLVCSLCHVLSARDSLANVEHVKFCNCFPSGSTERKIWGHATHCNFNLTRLSHQRKHRMVLTLDFRLEPVSSDDGSVPKATLENSQYTMYRVMVYLSLIYLLHSGRPVGLWSTSQLPTSQWTTCRAMVYLSSETCGVIVNFSVT